MTLRKTNDGDMRHWHFSKSTCNMRHGDTPSRAPSRGVVNICMRQFPKGAGLSCSYSSALIQITLWQCSIFYSQSRPEKASVFFYYFYCTALHLSGPPHRMVGLANLFQCPPKTNYQQQKWKIGPICLREKTTFKTVRTTSSQIYHRT